MALHTETAAASYREQDDAPRRDLSLPRLYALRFGYLFISVGLIVVKWPLFFHHDRAWAPFEGVVNCMLVAMSLLTLLGIRYPVRMLPILLFESAWKLIWLSVVAAPMWLGDGLDEQTASIATNCLFVVVVLAVVPWRYVVAQYLTEPGDRWRRDPARRAA